MMPLTMAAANEINYIKKVGGNSEVKRHRSRSRSAVMNCLGEKTMRIVLRWSKERKGRE